MKTLSLLLLVAILGSAKSSEPAVQKTTLCDLYQHPEKYAGKLVHVHASVSGKDLWIDDFQKEACPAWTNVTAVYPHQVQPPPGFSFAEDESFAKFQDALHKGMNVEATFEGRFDVAFVWRDHKRISVGSDKGYGKKHKFGARLVLQRVSEVVARPRYHK